MKRTACAGALVVALAGHPTSAAAQDEQPSTRDVLREIHRLRERIDELEQRHAEDQERIHRLEQRLARPRQDARPPSPQPPPPPAVTVPPGAADLTLPAQGAVGQGNLYNPAITAFFDLGASFSTNDDNERFNRFNLRETELDLRAAVAPWADGVLILAFGEEIESNAAGETEVDIEFEVEEAYIDFHTLPWDLAVRGGKFRNAFGVNNLLHTHDLPQITRPLAVEAFLGPEGLATIGGSLRWLVPNPWDLYLEMTAEVVNADGGAESPILGGPDADNPAFLGHVKWFTDVGDYGWFELGGSYLYARTSEDSAFDANVFGVDATLKLPDPEAPDLRSLLLQSELYWAANDIEDSPFGSFRNDSFGFYAFGQYQFLQNWYAGVRFDYTEFPSVAERGPGDADWALSPYLSWYPTEFLRLRCEYQHREFEVLGVGDDEDNILFGLTFSIGAHPTHPYWVNR